jgi:hypothetical protein
MAEIEILFRKVDEWSFCLWEQYVHSDDSEVWARILEAEPARGDNWRVRIAIEKSAFDRITAGRTTKRERDQAIHEALDHAGQAALDRMIFLQTIDEVPLADYVHPSFLPVEWSLSQADDLVGSIRSDKGEASKVMLVRTEEVAGDHVRLYVRLPESLLAALHSDGLDASLSDRVFSVIMTAHAQETGRMTSWPADWKIDDDIPF